MRKYTVRLMRREFPEAEIDYQVEHVSWKNLFNVLTELLGRIERVSRYYVEVHVE